MAISRFFVVALAKTIVLRYKLVKLRRDKKAIPFKVF